MCIFFFWWKVDVFSRILFVFFSVPKLEPSISIWYVRLSPVQWWTVISTNAGWRIGNWTLGIRFLVTFASKCNYFHSKECIWNGSCKMAVLCLTLNMFHKCSLLATAVLHIYIYICSIFIYCVTESSICCVCYIWILSHLLMHTSK